MTTESFIKADDLQMILIRRYGAPEDVLEDAFTQWIATAAENHVRAVAEQPGWVGEDPGPGQSLAPARARDIATLLAVRAWDPSAGNGTLQRRTSGPVSQTFDTSQVVRGLNLEISEDTYLRSQRGGSQTGIWVLGMQSKNHRRGGRGYYSGSDVFAPGGEIMPPSTIGDPYGLDR